MFCFSTASLFSPSLTSSPIATAPRNILYFSILYAPILRHNKYPLFIRTHVAAMPAHHNTTVKYYISCRHATMTAPTLIRRRAAVVTGAHRMRIDAARHAPRTSRYFEIAIWHNHRYRCALVASSTTRAHAERRSFRLRLRSATLSFLTPRSPHYHGLLGR